jgi:hypothetical protein
MVDKSPSDRIRTITIAPVGLEGLLGLPMDPTGIVLFLDRAHDCNHQPGVLRLSEQK